MRHKFVEAACRGACILAMASPLLAASAGVPGAPPGQEKFTGSWSAPVCDRQDPQRECGGFSLTLRQRGDTICGSRFVIAPGLGRQDEDEAGSVVGTVVGNSAVVVIRSTRNGASYLARATLVNRFLGWRIVGQITTKTSDDGAATIGFGYTFNRSDNLATWERAGIPLTREERDALEEIHPTDPTGRPRHAADPGQYANAVESRTAGSLLSAS